MGKVASPTLGKISAKEEAVATVSVEKEESEEVPLPQRLRSCLGWWRTHAPPTVVNVLRDGLLPDVEFPPLPSKVPCPPTGEALAIAKKTIGEYLKVGVVAIVGLALVRYLVPWFVTSKWVYVDNQRVEKHRFITDFRVPNASIRAHRFTLDH